MEVDPSDAAQLMTAAVTGGDSLSVTGFNLAPSPFLDCHWGGATAQPGATLRSFASPPPVCEDLRVRTSPHYYTHSTDTTPTTRHTHTGLTHSRAMRCTSPDFA